MNKTNITTPPPVSMPMDRGTPPITSAPSNRNTTPSTPIPNRETTPSTPIPNRQATPSTPIPNSTPSTPINRGTSPRTGMPINRTTPMNGTMPSTPSMPMNDAMPSTPTMPLNNIFMPSNTPYNTPMGVPLYPLYGYDNTEDLDKDMDYFRQLYPNSVRRIQEEINNECDKLEYDGSVMFDEYPDKITLDRMIDRIYEKVQDIDEAPQVEAKSVYYAPRRRHNLLRDLVSIVLLNELINRRRRYRGRRRWF